MNRLTEDALRYAAEHAPEPLRGLCAARLRQERKKLATRRERSAPRRAREATDRTTRNQRMAEIREQVMKRAGGFCELCGFQATEAHHIISGPLRRHMERVDTVIAVCRDHHRWLHQGAEFSLEQAHNYCVSCGMHDAAAALAKRLDKLHEAAGARAGRGGPDAETKDNRGASAPKEEQP